MIVCRYFRANYFHLGVLYKSHDLVYFVANPQKRLRCHTVWHPGNLLFSSLNVMFRKAPSWNAATMYYTGGADREWFARKRREIDERNKQIKSREIAMQLQVQETKKTVVATQNANVERRLHGTAKTGKKGGEGT